jgi:phenylpropionate dioxygenase-like ring-hydroxylating dioxygenase large terminal subunit
VSDAAEILDLLQENARRPFGEAVSLPPRSYTSDAFHRLEVERIFLREWLCIGRADDVPNAGDYMTTDLVGTPIVTVRTSAGDIRSFSNVCLHRGMRLLNGRGAIKSRIVCPYHAWNYDIGGQLVLAKHMERTPGFDIKTQHLPVVRTEVWEGWIYVTLDPSIAPVSEHLQELHEIVGRYGAERYVKIYHDEFEWRTNWKCLVENFMEDYHLPYVHRQTISGYSPTGEVEVFEGHDAFSYHLNRKTPDAPRGLAHADNKTLDGDWRRTTVLYAVLPAHLVNLSPDHLWYLTLQPRGTDRVSVRFGLSYAPEVLADVNDRDAFAAKWKQFFDAVNAEDRAVVEGVRAAAESMLARPGRLCHLERFTYDFGRYLHRRLAGADG